jgi:hypothetical protein
MASWLPMIASCLAAAFVACHPQRARHPLPREVTVYIAVSDQVAKTDSGNVAAMVDAIEADLREGGHFVSIVAARSDERAPLPRVELQVRTSDPADTELLAGAQLVSMAAVPVGVGVIAIGAGGSIEVDAFIVSKAGGAPTYLGRFASGSFLGSALGQDETNLAGERAGHDIAMALLR